MSITIVLFAELNHSLRDLKLDVKSKAMQNSIYNQNRDLTPKSRNHCQIVFCVI